jgi:hypothetical protein
MIHGNWVAIHKGLVKSLPDDRPFTELEAMFSLSVDADNGKPASVLGYSTLWGWNRNKVRKFLESISVSIIYPENTGKKQNQKGQIRGQIMDRSVTDKGQIRFIIDAALYKSKDRSVTDKGQISDRSGDTTIDPLNPKPKPNPKNKYSNEFESVWEITPKRNGTKQGKSSASKLFEKLSIEDKRRVYKGVKNYSQYISLPTTTQSAMDLERFIRNRFFDDYQDAVNSQEKIYQPGPTKTAQELRYAAKGN